MTSSPRGLGPEAGADWFEELAEAMPPDAQVRSSEAVVLPPEPHNVRLARRWVAGRLPQWAEHMSETVVLMTSELVTNAVVHARTELVLGLALTDHDLVVGVRDQDLGRKELDGPERHGGRGLRLVAELSSASGRVRHAGGGKTYWFRVSA